MTKLGKFAAAGAAVVCAFGTMAALLPAEYQEVEWIESTGSQCVNLGFAPDKTKTGVVMRFNSGTYQSEKAFFGTGWGNNRYLFCQQSDYYKFYAANVSLTTKDPNRDMTLTILADGTGKGHLTLENPDGASWKIFEKDVDLTPNSGNLKLFAIDKSYGASFRLYRLSVYSRTVTPAEEDGGEDVVTQELVHDFVPCYRVEDGEIGLYDLLATDTAAGFKADSNKATTKFKKGENVYYPDEVVISGSQEDFGAVTPGYGRIQNLAVGATIPCSAPASVTVVEGRTIADCIGYKVIADGVVVQKGAFDPEVDGDTRGFTYTHPQGETGARIVWQWRRRHWMTVTATTGGSVAAPTAKWVKEGENADFEASADEGYVFYGWRNAETVRFGTTLDMMISQPTEIEAVFVSSASADKTWTGGASDGLWESAGNWSPAGVPTITDNVTIPANAYVTVRTGKLRARGLSVGSKATLEVVAADDDTVAYEIMVGAGGIVVDGTMNVGRKKASPDDLVAVAGDFTVNATGVVSIYAAQGLTATLPDWRAFKRGGTLVSVGGDFTMAAGAKVTTYNSPSSWLGVVFAVASNATIAQNAVLKSCGNARAYNKTVSVFPCAPYYPGNGGTYQTSYGESYGGGTIRLDVGGTLDLQGKLNAAVEERSGWNQPPGHGGSIWVTCDALTVGAAGSINAQGANWTGGAPGGMGGHVAVMTGGMTEWQIDNLYRSGEADDATVLSEDMNDAMTYAYPSLVNVLGGVASDGKTRAAKGTSRYLMNKIGRVQLVVAGNEYAATTTPAYGKQIIAAGPVKFTAPQFVDVAGGAFTEASVSRFECLGYEYVGADGVKHEGNETTVTVEIADDTVFTWKWSKVQHKFIMSSAGYGTVSDHLAWYEEGTVLPVVATPAADCEFVRWTGEMTAAELTAASSTVTIDRPRRIVALFQKSSGEERNLTVSGTLDWYDPANWADGAAPTANDTVTIVGNTTVTFPGDVDVKALVVESGTFNLATVDGIANVKLSVAGDLTVASGAAIVIGKQDRIGRADISVGGDLVLNGTGKLTAYAGNGALQLADATWVDYKRGGAAVDIAGNLVLNDTSVFTTYVSQPSGVGVVFNVGGDVTIGAGASIRAHGWVFDNSKKYGLGTIFPGSGQTGAGGSYGNVAQGGTGNNTPKPAYGLATAPYYPGSAGSNGKEGGGSIRLNVTGDVNLDGKLNAYGEGGGGYSANGGSGGGVWITCNNLNVGEAAKINAYGGTQGSVAGAGGRVAIMTGAPTDEQIDSLYETGTCDYLSVLSDDMNDASTYALPSLVSVAGGWSGGKGTSRYMMNSYGLVTITVQGNEYTSETTPLYGTDMKKSGSFTFTAPQFVDVAGGAFTEASVSRFECLGYEYVGADGVKHEGDETTVTVEIADDTVFTWKWSKVQHRLDFTSGGYGMVNDPGRWQTEDAVVTLVATPDAGCEFVRWVGETTSSEEELVQTTSTLIVDRPRRVTAVFEKTGAEDRNLVISGSIDWYDLSAWDGTAIPTRNDTVTVTGDTTVDLASMMAVKALVVQSGTLTIGTGHDIPAKLKVVGDLTVANGAKVVFGMNGKLNFMDLEVGGDLTLDGTGSFTFYAGGAKVTNPTWEDEKRGGTKVDVVGDLTLNNTSKISTYANSPSWLSVVFNVGGDVMIARDAAITGVGSAPTLNRTVTRFEKAPFYPGEGGYYSNGGGQAYGGGAVRLNVTGDVLLDGKIVVTGGTGGSWNAPAGTGGNVWITCDEFKPSSDAKINADGGVWGYGKSGAVGGHVAILTGAPSVEQIDSLYQTGDAEDLIVVAADMNDPLAPYPTLVNVAGGHASVANGTAVLMKSTAGQVVIHVVGNEPTTQTLPTYGDGSIEKGLTTFTAPQYIDISGGAFTDASVSRYVCAGYAWSDADGGSGEGDGNSVDIDVQSELTITWKWSVVQHKLAPVSGGYGAIGWDAIGWYAHGSPVTLVAQPEAECAFVRWAGDLDAEDDSLRNVELTVTMDRPREIVASFQGAAPRALVWNAASANLDWFDRANWDGVAIPSPIDTVAFTGGAFRVKFPTHLAVAGWTQGGNTVGFFGTATNLVIANVTYVSPVKAADARDAELRVAGAMTLADTAKLWVGGLNTTSRNDVVVGSLTLQGGAQLEMYAGYEGPMEDYRTYENGGATLEVRGNLLIADTAQLLPVCHQRTGAPVLIKVGGRATVDEQAKINADFRGFGCFDSQFYGPGAHPRYADGSATRYPGGSYGGLGGWAKPQTYPSGIGALLAPYYPGSAGAYGKQFSGGGAVRMVAGRIYLNGTISANGYGYNGDTCGGSGGGIWLACRKIFLGEHGLLVANGGNSGHVHGSIEQDLGAGGGGRIAVMVKADETDVGKLCRDKTLKFSTMEMLSALSDWEGHYQVNGGAFGTNSPLNGASGTAVWLKAKEYGMAVIVR